jgi:multidrug efflux pump subunit AcrA (membrane-fusion protein)
LANQQATLEAQRLAEQSKQFGASNQINAFSQAAQAGQTLGNLGQLQQNLDLSRLGAQSQAAAQQQALEQQRLDNDYANFLQQRDYNWQQLGNYSNIMRGVPIESNKSYTTYGQAPSLMGQITGAGLTALGAYNMGRG